MDLFDVAAMRFREYARRDGDWYKDEWMKYLDVPGVLRWKRTDNENVVACAFVVQGFCLADFNRITNYYDSSYFHDNKNAFSELFADKSGVGACNLVSFMMVRAAACGPHSVTFVIGFPLDNHDDLQRFKMVRSANSHGMMEIHRQIRIDMAMCGLCSVPLSTLRCPCYSKDSWYCDEACQRAHVAKHKKAMVHRMWSSGDSNARNAFTKIQKGIVDAKGIIKATASMFI